MSKHLKVAFADSGREPRCAPNPAYPDGIDIDVTQGATPACQTALPYPARRCGQWVVHCMLCGRTVAITAAGRPDDPRSLTLPCKPMTGVRH